MAQLISLFVLAFAVSVDSFGTGLAYGLRKLQLSSSVLIFISICSGVSVLLGAAGAGLLTQFIPDAVTETIGGMLLIAIGSWAVLQVMKKEKPAASETLEIDKGSSTNFMKQTIEIIKTPEKADMDDSGSISWGEAVLLSAALSLDAFGAGISAALLGLNAYYLAAAVAVLCAFFLAGGRSAGEKLSAFQSVQKLSFAPGVLLICLGLLNLS
ncbi:sporulation membrane protein YtaF [Alteribacillus sp. HJP-4]|uniref:sporulation membrane protein YtaF n=1 Tax=Alteribacillus sp. HJP-4 TaxID=2775394 RepID=UPI0035CD1856